MTPPPASSPLQVGQALTEEDHRFEMHATMFGDMRKVRGADGNSGRRITCSRGGEAHLTLYGITLPC